MLIFLLLTACSTTTTKGADAIAQVEDLRSLVTAHQETVDSFSSMDDVSTEEASHAEAMAAMMGDMDAAMSSMMGCMMGDMMSGSMSDADTHMAEMMDVVTTHTADHAGHADMSACIAEEDTYVASMGEHLDSMSMDMSGFDADADCSGTSGGMM